MTVNVVLSSTSEVKKAAIKLIVKTELPLKKEGWNFNWKELFKIEGSVLYKICLLNTPNRIEGILMLSMFNDEMLFMNNIELAPHNIGKSKRYDQVAGVLLAFACKVSFEKGKGHYNGFLSFDSKTKLVSIYQEKYGASVAMGHKMFFDPEAGKNLMRKYLNITKS